MNESGKVFSAVLRATLAIGVGALAFSVCRAADAPKVEVEKSSSTATGTSAADMYNASGLRDPFAAPGSPAVTAAASPAPAATQQPEAFSIHNLYLRGIMRDRLGDYAMLVSQSGIPYILKKGRLLGPKNKPVPGVKGKTFAAQKKVVLETPDKDVQTLILGEDNKEGL